MLLSKSLLLPCSLTAALLTFSSTDAVSVRPPEPSRRSLQTTAAAENGVDPCDRLVNQDYFYPNDNLWVYVPSAYEACIESLPLNATQVDEHLWSLGGIFKEY